MQSHCSVDLKKLMDSTFLRFASLLLLLSLASSANPNSDHNSLVYKKCANQTFTTLSTKSQVEQQTLSSFFQQLTSHSSQSKFYKHAEAGGDDNEEGISGLFQCRQDISNEECHTCVNTLRNLSNALCKESVSARVQLHGCYVHYELDGVDSEPSSHRLMHKTCENNLTNGVVAGFEEMRAAAFAALESGVADGGGFCQTSYEAVQVMAQCVGGLGGCECGECVSRAVQIAEEECGGAVSGQIYLEACLLSYSYHPDGIPADGHPDGIPADGHPDDPENKGGGNGGNGGNGKKVAILVGGAAALGFAFIFLLFVRSWSKKEDD